MSICTQCARVCHPNRQPSTHPTHWLARCCSPVTMQGGLWQTAKKDTQLGWRRAAINPASSSSWPIICKKADSATVHSGKPNASSHSWLQTASEAREGKGLLSQVSSLQMRRALLSNTKTFANR